MSEPQPAPDTSWLAPPPPKVVIARHPQGAWRVTFHDGGWPSHKWTLTRWGAERKGRRWLRRKVRDREAAAYLEAHGRTLTEGDL